MKDADIKIVGLSNSKPKSKTNWKVLSAIIGIIVLAVGVIAGIILVRQNQNISEKAAECSAGGAQCPSTSDPTLLRDCSTGEIYPNDSICDSAGRVEVCGTNSSNAKQFCCPSAGGNWTTNLSSCAVVTATATATTRATATATATATSTATATATATSTSSSKTATPTSTSKSTATVKATSTASAAPLPVTGSSWTTMLGAGFGIIMILVSLSLAL